MKNYKYLLFDLDGTLTDSKKRLYCTYLSVVLNK